MFTCATSSRSSPHGRGGLVRVQRDEDDRVGDQGNGREKSSGHRAQDERQNAQHERTEQQVCSNARRELGDPESVVEEAEERHGRGSRAEHDDRDAKGCRRPNPAILRLSSLVRAEAPQAHDL